MTEIIKPAREFFITLYTDASYDHRTKQAVIAWKGRCDQGPLSGCFTVYDCPDVQCAEMKAIAEGIKMALLVYPDLKGFFINSDNKYCVELFWEFTNSRPNEKITLYLEEVLSALGTGRWIRTKHVKAHTSGDDIRSHMNRSVDKMTRKGKQANKRAAKNKRNYRNHNRRKNMEVPWA